MNRTLLPSAALTALLALCAGANGYHIIDSEAIRGDSATIITDDNAQLG